MASKAEYLKKYRTHEEEQELSSQKKLKRKKKDKIKTNPQTLDIFDDDPNYEWGKPDEQKPVISNKVEEEPTVVTDDQELLAQIQKIKKMGEEDSGWTAIEIDEKVIDALSDPTTKTALKMKLAKMENDNEEANALPQDPKRSDQNNNLSPPRKGSRLEDASPPRKRRHDSPMRSESPPRKRHNSSIRNNTITTATTSMDDRNKKTNDLTLRNDPPSPKKKKARHDSPPRFSEKQSTSNSSNNSVVIDNSEKQRTPMTKTTNTVKSTPTVKKESNIAAQKKDNVYIDRHGRRLDFLTEFMRKEEGNFATEEDAKGEWGGKKPTSTDDKALNKIPATTFLASDSETDKKLRDRERDGDPMAEYFRKKKKSKSTEPEKPIYNGPPPPPNRFNIPPSHKWDGVNRSNGFEDKYFKRIAQKSATVEEAYKWSVEDM